MRRALVAASMLCLLLVTAPPASAATVSVADFFFSPTSIKLAQGGTVSWHNGGSVTHTSTQNAPLALWDTGHIAAGATSAAVTIKAAGSYAYHCTIHASMTGTVRVPIKVAPTNGTTSTTFTITLASGSMAGYSFDVQKKKGANVWKAWKTGVTSLRVTFEPRSVGTFRFRSRLHRTGTAATSGWSRAKAIKVS